MWVWFIAKISDVMTSPYDMEAQIATVGTKPSVRFTE